MLSSKGIGFENYDEDTGIGELYTALSQIGIYTETDDDSDDFGLLQIDEDDLETALDEDPKAVAMLFAADGESESDSSNVQVISTIDGLTNSGTYDIEYNIVDGELISATVDGVEAKIDGWTILAQSDSEANGLYLRVTDTSEGEGSATVRVKQGKSGELVDAISDMIDGETGTLTILINSYEESITNIENQIYNESKRLDAKETALTTQYATLEALLSEYSNTESEISSLISALS